MSTYTSDDYKTRTYTWEAIVTLRNGARMRGFIDGRDPREVRAAIRGTVQGRDARSVTIARVS